VCPARSPDHRKGNRSRAGPAWLLSKDAPRSPRCGALRTTVAGGRKARSRRGRRRPDDLERQGTRLHRLAGFPVRRPMMTAFSVNCFRFVLDLDPALCLFGPVPPSKGCFRRCLVAGRHRRARVWLATAGLARGGGLRSEGRRRLELRRADAVSGSRGSRPAVQGPYRLSGSARLPGASPGGGVPSVLSGADLGPVLRLVGSSPRCGSRSRSTCQERSARKRLRCSGGSPPS
jgi:hypothetical protein